MNTVAEDATRHHVEDGKNEAAEVNNGVDKFSNPKLEFSTLAAEKESDLPRLIQGNGGNILSSEGDVTSHSCLLENVLESGDSSAPTYSAGGGRNHIAMEFLASKQLIAELCKEVTEYVIQNEFVENGLLRLSKELKSFQEEFLKNQEEISQANNVLVANSASVIEELKETVYRQKILTGKMKTICEAVNNFTSDKSQGFLGLLSTNGQSELSQGLRNFHQVSTKPSPGEQGRTEVEELSGTQYNSLRVSSAPTSLIFQGSHFSNLGHRPAGLCHLSDN